MLSTGDALQGRGYLESHPTMDTTHPGTDPAKGAEGNREGTEHADSLGGTRTPEASAVPTHLRASCPGACSARAAGP